MNTQEHKTKLEAEKALVESELSELGQYNESEGAWEAKPEAQANGPESDSNDLADRAEDFEERSSTLSILVNKLNDIDSSIRKIDAGTYGVCEKCGNKIEEDRLEANMAAQTCKNCM